MLSVRKRAIDPYLALCQTPEGKQQVVTTAYNCTIQFGSSVFYFCQEQSSSVCAVHGVKREKKVLCMS